MYIIGQFYQRAVSFGLCLVSFCCLSYGNNDSYSLRFADREEANNVLAVSKGYVERLGKFDLEARVGKKNATHDDMVDMIRRETRDFTDIEKDSVVKAFAILDDAIARKGLNLPIPQEVLLIKTTMKEEGGAAAYTRGEVVCLGEGLLKKVNTKRLAKLLAHELFHVMTRNNIDFRKSMYKIIGFSILDKEIKFSDDVTERFISNPDVNHYDSYAMLSVGGKQQPCTMVICSDRDYAGGSFFDYVHIGLVPLDDKFSPVMKDGKMLMYKLDDASDFYDKVGRNTGYVINPEECLADNFSIALCGDVKELPNPEIINEIVSTIRNFNVD